MKVCIYTAIFGNYDRLQHQAEQSIDCDFICFTDSLLLRRDAKWKYFLQKNAKWDIRVTQPRFFHPRLSAKWFKMMPHRELQRYDYTIWIDGSFRITSSLFAQTFMDAIADNVMGVFWHPERNCIYEEAEYCVSNGVKKYHGLPLIEQVNSYRTQGYPEKSGLYSCGLIVRKGGSKECLEFDEEWLSEILEWTYQDQLSFPFLAWKRKLSFKIFGGDIRNHPMFCLHSHLSEE